MEKFNLRVKKSQPGLSIISVDSFMEKFHEHKVLNEVNFEDESEQTGQSKETNMIFLELEDSLKLIPKKSRKKKDKDEDEDKDKEAKQVKVIHESEPYTFSMTTKNGSCEARDP